jgi:hypothetical protein
MAVPPPPTSETIDELWWGARNGGCETSPPGGRATPAAECTIVTSSASLAASRGKRPASLVASIVLPDPGGPTIKR